MFPIRDHNPSGRTPYVTMALIAVNIAVFLSYWHLFSNPPALMRFYVDYALIPAWPQPHSFVTSMFLHGGFWHIAGNMLFLWIFGDNLEDEMGHIGFLLFYLASGVAAGIVHVALSQGSTVPTVGASGAIAGVMGGYLLMFPRARIDILIIIIIIFRIITVPAWLMLVLWFGMQVIGAAGSDPDMGGVAYWAHAGGFAIGAAFAVPLWLRRGGRDFWNRTHGLPPHPARPITAPGVPVVRRKHR
ncbi:rhomboid family intramembrane serine protease [Tropicimonas sediminicola]|uniref:Membrane associated serine protease, rhomboid family n=1 Tax=Tropicimonas sediminicola TaxID=1031541 RepID=A0A239LUE9_9RHOB|nr:rhomboid family intramembrane serine protease [Tropicimonas sediminicola]SNT33254.1 Membrane associated serine protease, rhomboid family [Tropicimonas sediminicola]